MAEIYDFGYGGSGDVSVNETITPDTVDEYNVVGGAGTQIPGGGSLGAPVTSTGTINFNNFDWGKAANALLGGSGGGMGAGLALGLGALAAALSKQQAPTVKFPEYKPVPVYNRALTSPMMQPQPAPQKSASGQNIYQPMTGLPYFFNPNPFQFDPTEAAKRYGPTPEQIAQGKTGYEAGLAALFKPMTITPFTYGSTVTGATGNDTVGGGSTSGGATTEDTSGGASGGSVENLTQYNDGGDIYMAAGRYLSGGGDGMSDSIPATINDRQPARLADGEFIVPADVVSDLGNGSSNAGAKKLYAMMNKIRKARHGTTKQPPEVKAERTMPA